MDSTQSSCNGFDGNPDLYGLGIRIGTYLQWYSTWLSVTLNPRSAGEIHLANSVFVFAISAALLQAVRRNSINPIEAYLMLQICMGFVLTLLSIFGIRLQLLGPRRAERFACTAAKIGPPKLSWLVVAARVYSGLSGSELFPWSKGSAQHTNTVSLSKLATLKHTSLSWAGSLWRTGTSAIVIFTNLWLLYYGVDELPKHGLCGTSGEIFMFSKQQFMGSLLVFLKIVATIMAVVTGLVSTVVGMVFFHAVMFFGIAIFVDTTLRIRNNIAKIIQTSEERWGTQPNRDSGCPTRVRVGLSILRYFTVAKALYTALHLPFIYKVLMYISFVHSMFGSPLNAVYGLYGMVFEMVESAMSQDAPPQPLEILSLYAVFASKNRNDRQPPTKAGTEVAHRPIGVILSTLWHMWMVGTMTWFILSIELAIKWNHIRGVNQVDTTGQLIPFVTGIVSFAQANHQLLLSIIKKICPKWYDVDLEIELSDGVPKSYRIIRINSADIDGGRTQGLAPRQNPSGAWEV